MSSYTLITKSLAKNFVGPYLACQVGIQMLQSGHISNPPESNYLHQKLTTTKHSLKTLTSINPEMVKPLIATLNHIEQKTHKQLEEETHFGISTKQLKDRAVEEWIEIGKKIKKSTNPELLSKSNLFQPNFIQQTIKIAKQKKKQEKLIIDRNIIEREIEQLILDIQSKLNIATFQQYQLRNEYNLIN